MIPLLSIRFFSPRSGRFSAALLVSTALVMLCFLLLHLLPLGRVTLSVTSAFTRSSRTPCRLVLHGWWLF